jgi:phosphotransferase system enzyme I (PtsI)
VKTRLVGTGVSAGVAVGPALVVEREAVSVFRVPVAAGEEEKEVQRLLRATEAARGQLLAIKERLSREVGVPHAYIFDAQLLMLEDPLLIDRAAEAVRQERVNAEWALRTVAEQLHALFDEFTDAYLKERSTDLDDVLGRVQLNLAGGGDAPSLSRLPSAFVVVAVDLSPSEAAELDWHRVLAVATDAGSATYHTAILARSLGIPAVVGLSDATHVVPAGALVLVDGTRGELLVEPSAPTLASVRVLQERDRIEDERLQATRTLPALTRDRVSVRLQANVEFPEEAGAAVRYGAEGIGLFRSEYLLGRAGTWPSEDKQVEVYRLLLEQVRPHPVTIRAWDVGVEDIAPGGPSSSNPALGERALRLVRRSPEPFRIQLRALLRAAAHGPVRILLPFVSGVEDLRTALDLLAEAREGLRAEGATLREDVAIGINLEVPSAAVTVDLLAPHVDFFGIGTNDLIQYLLAVDRADPRVSSLYRPLHPAVLRTIDGIVKAAGTHGVPVSLCGEMAADPLQCLALLGLGVRELSMAPAAIPRVKAALREVTAAEARAVAVACLSLPTADEIEARLRRDLGAALTAATDVPDATVPLRDGDG